MEIRLDDQRILVTGGSSGLGEAMVRALTQAGARVAINYSRSADAAERIAEDVRQDGADVFTVQTDVSDPGAVKGMFERIDAEWGGLDVLINNAGIDGKPASSWEIDVEDWQRVLQVNLFGAFHCAREALRRMVPQQRGVILNTSSVHEVIPWSGYSAYAASKAGLGMLARSLALEASPHGVRVLSLAPGAIRTPINESVWRDPEGLKDLLTKIPLGRIGEPEDIARMTVVLVSDVAGYMTGTTVYVDGGMTDYPSFMQGG